ncbi:DUF2911 domain-containing protein [Pelagicoccus sp. SDUM812005]|uniref:DUF2911 domain-containing protein n=1 Tax=Pelagicoccus sp. SDUM812005 TaxID=3041257 RepID=UPI00280F87D9|nr:DUF2911 domain-containing protein [Pelagicoccus sp. SDUM812005]MDQ8179224.1 DUF2911 domain-containing protein [Pelagicoccus sp. SDUM812005]
MIRIPTSRLLGTLLLSCLAALSASTAFAQMAILPQASPAASVTQTVGITEISVSYSRPSVNGRPIWGELVPYGLTNLGWTGEDEAAPWRAGANENTVVTFEHDAKVEGKAIPAGSYGLHLIVEASGDVTVIFSKDYQSWGSYFYDPAKDALRVKVKSQPRPHQEQLSYSFSDITKSSAVLSLDWEKKSIPIKISVDTDAIVLASLKQQMRNAHGFRYQNIMDAANYLLANDLELELALEWSEIAISRPWVGRKLPETYELKAKILDKLGRASEAAAVRAEIASL